MTAKIWMLAAALAGAATLPATVQAQSVAFKFAHMNGPTHPVHQGALRLKEAIEARTGKQVQLEIFPSGQLGENTAIGEQISLGSGLVGQISFGVLADYVPDFSILVYPFLFKNWDQAKSLFASPLVKDLEKKAEANNLKVLCYMNFGTRDLYTRAKPVRAPADTGGLKMRVQPVTLYTEMVKSMGATPTPMPWPEVYSALSQGVIDAAEAPPNAVLEQKHYEHARFYMKTNHIVDISPIVTSLAAFNRLSAANKTAFQEEAQKACDWMSEETARSYDASIEQLRQRGMTIVEDVDRAAFGSRAEGIAKAFPKWSAGLLDKVKQSLAAN